MRDGQTRRLERAEAVNAVFEEFKARFQPTLVLESGEGAGSEFPLEQTRMILGRGNDIELSFADPSLSSEHAVFEYFDGGFRVRDLGSLNGLRVNGGEAQLADLKHGDRLELGSQTFRFVLAERSVGPRTYEVPLD